MTPSAPTASVPVVAPAAARLPAAVLWDMDGTIIDTEPYWQEAESALLAEHGATWDHDLGLQLVGQGLWSSAEILRTRGVDMNADSIVEWLVAKVDARLAEALPFRPGAVELVGALADAGIPQALVTMSTRPLADQLLAALPLTASVTGEEVERPKPFPDAYLLGAELLGVDVHACIAIEDSPPGLAAARASGAVTIGVPHHVPLAPGAADALWATLAGAGLDDLAAVFGRARS